MEMEAITFTTADTRSGLPSPGVILVSSSLRKLREFIVSRGIRPVPKITFTSGAFVLIVGKQAEVLKTAHELLPFVSKKKDEFQTIVDYLEDRVTGTEVFQRFKALQDLGAREKNRYPSNGKN